MNIEITSFIPYQKSTLQGFIAVRLTETGLEIRDIALHRKNGKRWLQLPAKPYKKPEAANLFLLLAELANEKGQVKTNEEELAILMEARFNDYREYQL